MNGVSFSLYQLIIRSSIFSFEANVVDLNVGFNKLKGVKGRKWPRSETNKYKSNNTIRAYLGKEFIKIEVDFK